MLTENALNFQNEYQLSIDFSMMGAIQNYSDIISQARKFGSAECGLVAISQISPRNSITGVIPADENASIPDGESLSAFHDCSKNYLEFSEGITALIDWLSVTGPEQNLQALFELVKVHWPEIKFIEADRGTSYYKRKWIAPHGVTILADPTTAGRSECNIFFPGSALRELSVFEQFYLFKFLDTWGFKPTRIDIALRDFTRTLCPFKLDKAWEDGKIKGFRKFKLEKIYDPKFGKGGIARFGGRGSKGSGKYLRVYDKFVESRGRENSIACELELSDHKAKAFWQHLLAIDIEDIAIIPQLIATTINGSITVAARFWQKIFKDLAAIKLPSKKKNTISIQKISQWLYKQVFPTLSVYFNWLFSHDDSINRPGDYLWEKVFWNDIIFEGLNRANDKQKNALFEAIGSYG